MFILGNDDDDTDDSDDANADDDDDANADADENDCQDTCLIMDMIMMMMVNEDERVKHLISFLYASLSGHLLPKPRGGSMFFSMSYLPSTIIIILIIIIIIITTKRAWNFKLQYHTKDLGFPVLSLFRF